MAAIARLRHVIFVTSGKVYVPFGSFLRVVEGVVEVDTAEPNNVLSLWYDGYRLDAETGEEIRPGQLDGYIARLNSDEKPAETTETDTTDNDPDGESEPEGDDEPEGAED